MIDEDAHVRQQCHGIEEGRGEGAHLILGGEVEGVIVITRRPVNIIRNSYESNLIIILARNISKKSKIDKMQRTEGFLDGYLIEVVGDEVVIETILNLAVIGDLHRL